MDVLLVALGSASAPCSVGDDRGEGDTVDHGGVPLESRDPVLDVSQRLGAAGENGDLAAVFERVRQDVMPGRASGGRSGGSKKVVGAWLSGAHRFLRSWGIASLTPFSPGAVAQGPVRWGRSPAGFG